MFRILICSLFVMLPGTLLAGSANGQITSILVSTDNPGLAFIKVEGAYGNNTCQTNTTWNFAFDISTNTGKAQLSTALMAHASGITVWVSEKANTNCDLLYNVQTMAYIYTVK